ncbi:MAG: acyl carrier protein [Desulfobulbus sp.]|nr:acyl carrier protein [Desulfobulbus sp.]
MTEQELHQIIASELGKVAPECSVDELDPDENIREAMDIDSYSFLCLLIGLGDRTGIEIPEADYARVATLAAMKHYLRQRLAL